MCLTLGPTEVAGCTTDDECPPREMCRNRQCLEPCSVLNPCAPSAECQVCYIAQLPLHHDIPVVATHLFHILHCPF